MKGVWIWVAEYESEDIGTGKLAFTDREDAMDWINYVTTIESSAWEQVSDGEYVSQYPQEYDDLTIDSAQVKAVRISDPESLFSMGNPRGGSDE